MNGFDLSKFTFKPAFDLDAERKFGANSLLIFALGLYTQAEDLRALAADALTDGGGDKKCDACIVDTEEERAIIVQSYCSQDWGLPEAKANKADDLNTAVTWLLSMRLEEVPERIRSKAQDLRLALDEGKISRIDILYIHNCRESENVSKALEAVALTTKKIVDPDSVKGIAIVPRELGLNSIEELFKAADKVIVVEDVLRVPGQKLGNILGPKWKAVVITADGQWLRTLFNKHHDDLFSANYRGYLGTTRRRRNINAQIKNTVATQPENFWVFNNGVTILTKKIDERDGQLQIHGCSIINGAQTSGSLGEAIAADSAKAHILCRIVECSDRSVVDQIVRFNNTQNAFRPADMRSGDATQQRLASDFRAFGVSYVHRRIGTATPKEAISAESIAPSLAAFHGKPQLAGRNRSQIFENEAEYRSLFDTAISAQHVYMAHALAIALDKLKLSLKSRVAGDTATDLERQQYQVLEHSMSKYFLLYIIGRLAEELLGTRVVDLKKWVQKDSLVTADPTEASDIWINILEAILPLLAVQVTALGTAYEVTRSEELSKKAGGATKAVLAAFKKQIEAQLQALRNATCLT